MAEPLSVPNAHFLGFWLMLILAGIYISYLPRTVSIMRSKWRDGVLPMWLPTAAVLMFIVFCLHLGIEMHRSWEAFAMHGKEPPSPLKFYMNVTTPESLIKNALTPIVAILSDTIIVYRTFTIWQSHRWVGILPLALLMAGLGTAIWAIWTLAQTRPGDVLIMAAVTQRIRIFFIITFVLNVVSSALIAFKLWNVSSRISDQQLSTGKVLNVIVESAAIYCAHLFALIVTSLVGSNAFFVFLDPLPQTTVIVFNLLILRVASDSRKHTSSMNYPSMTSSFAVSRRTRNPTSAIGVEIDLERVVHSDVDSSRLSALTVHPYGAHLSRVSELDDDKERGTAL